MDWNGSRNLCAKCRRTLDLCSGLALKDWKEKREGKGVDDQVINGGTVGILELGSR